VSSFESQRALLPLPQATMNRLRPNQMRLLRAGSRPRCPGYLCLLILRQPIKRTLSVGPEWLQERDGLQIMTFEGILFCKVRSCLGQEQRKVTTRHSRRSVDRSGPSA
jgi:hypothetical protein